MKAYLFASVILLNLWSPLSKADSSAGIVYTNLADDCVVESAATDQAPIDFYSAQCKSFGDYVLKIVGSDSRYSPQLWYHDQQINLDRPMSFHDLADQKIEWIYNREFNNEGSGKIEWKDLLYSLSAANEDGSSDAVQYYAILLNKEQTCTLGVTASADDARKLVLDPAAVCK